MKKILFFILVLSFLSLPAFPKKPIKKFSEFKFIPHAGLSWQSTCYKPVFDFSAVNELGISFLPYNHEKNTQGFGLDLGFTLSTNISDKFQLGIKMNGRFRYDYIYGGVFGWPGYEDEFKSFLFDYSTAFTLSYTNQNNKDWVVELGFTANQMGKSHLFELHPDNQTTTYSLFNYQYNSYNFALGYDVVKLSPKSFINTAFTFNYIPNGYPGYRFRSFMTMGVKATIRFKPGSLVLKKMR